MLEQRRRPLADVVQMLYKCFVFAGLLVCSRMRVIDTARKRTINLLGINPFSPRNGCKTSLTLCTFIITFDYLINQIIFIQLDDY